MRSALTTRLLLAAASFFVFHTAARAADAPPPPREGIAIIDDYADAVKNAGAPWLTIGAGASFSYQYDFENPDSGIVGLRLLDKDHDTVPLAQSLML